MKVLRLRSHYGVPALKGEQSWGEGDPGTELRALSNGHFIVSKYGKHVLIPGAAVVSADVEPEQQADEAKRGPGRPRKEVTE